MSSNGEISLLRMSRACSRAEVKARSKEFMIEAYNRNPIGLKARGFDPPSPLGKGGPE